MPKPLFKKSSISESLLARHVGEVPERPFVIKAAVKETSLGDLLCKLICLATIKNQFDYGEIELRYRDVRPYSREAVMLVPEIDRAIAVKGHIPLWLRLGWPDTRLWNPLARSIDGNKGSWGAFCDFYPTDWMLNPRWLHAVPNPAPLRVPDKVAEGLEKELIGLGLNRDTWFAVLHYRASNYLGKRSGVLRNGDPQAYRQLVDHIIDHLGGQAVLLGHPELEAFPARPGFVDLSRIPNSFLLQAYASQSARFMVAGPSGPIALGRGFQIPTGLVDASDPVGGWGSGGEVVLSHEVTTPDGRVLRNQDLLDAGLFDYSVLRDKIRAGETYSVRKNSAEELKAVANHVYDMSDNMTSWRPPKDAPKGPRPNQILWPPKTSENLFFIDL